jgi:hypothetical protein
VRKPLLGLVVCGATVLAACGRVTSVAPGSLTPSPSPIVPISDSQPGLQRCLAWQGNARAYQLEAAFDSNAGAIAAWRDKLAGSNASFPVQNNDPALVGTVCYFRGSWAVPAPPGNTEVWDRGIIFAYADGSTVAGPVGNAEGAPPNALPLNRPST